jgi:peptidoglycan/LPS O-acetylase OafA/YrhL
MNSINYRPDIDGLRAIAVLSVLVHHLNASILPGGFVGVDIFFVISGYLITAQVYREVCDGKFFLKEFYKRRINRIVPALFVVIIVASLTGVFLLSPSDLVRLTESAISSMFGVSNIYFWRTYGGYFSGNAAEAPLLHTWSLGVEEQFYAVWPLLIFLLVKFSRRYVFVALGALTIAAVIISQVAIGVVASASYYLLPTRVFELMIGGILAVRLADKKPESPHYSGFCLYAGLLLIFGSLLWLNKTSSFPGVNAIWPCLGAALLIWAGNSARSPSKILTSRPMVFLGLISYSLYLYHWPIVAYLNYLDIAIGPLVATAVAGLSIVMAWASWKFVEVPLRRNGALLSFGRVFAFRFVLPCLCLLSIVLSAAYTGGYPQRFDSRVVDLEKAIEARPELLRRGCHVPSAMYYTVPSEKCRLGTVKSDVDGVLIGDSFANHFTGMLDVMAKAQGLSIIDYTMDGCPPILGYEQEERKGTAYGDRCRKRNEAAYAMITASRYRRVVLAGNWPKKPEAGPLLVASIKSALSSGAQITVILSNETIEGAAACPIRNVMYGRGGSCEAPPQGAPDYFNDIRSLFPQVQIIDPNQVICTRTKCSPTLNGTLLYRDGSHLNDVGSRRIGNALLHVGVRLGG